MVIHGDWSQLPSELLGHIAEHLISISDFIRFRSVCKSWRSAALPNKLRPQPPLFLLPHYESIPHRYVFSLATRQAHHLFLPELVGKKILDITAGWMLIFDEEAETLSIINPISLAQIQLPQGFVCPVDCGFLFQDSSADSFVVFIPELASSSYSMGFVKVGDESWNSLASLRHCCSDIVYLNGKFFGFTGNNLYTHDASLANSDEPVLAGSIAEIPQIGSTRYSNSLVTVDGELFMLCEGSPSRDPHDECFLLYKLDYDGQQVKCSKLSLENHALLMSWKQLILCSVKDFPQYKEHCIYSHWKVDGSYAVDMNMPLVSIFDSKDGSSDLIECGLEMPHGLMEPPLWFTPSL